MTAWLVRRLIRNYQSTRSPAVREAYGTLGSVTGVIVNIVLAGAKLAMGLLTGSLAVTADAANNFSDAAGSVVALISVRVSNKPMDKEHPFGHGRMEYIGSLGVGAIIVLMGLALLRDGVEAIITPRALEVSTLALCVLAGSMLCKLWLYFFYRYLGRAIDSGTLLAAGKDSLSDVLATCAVLISLVLKLCFGWHIDGYIGVLVALVVLKAGYEVCRDTVGSLLGGKPDPEKLQQIRQLLLGYDGILGVHDLVLHDYGPGRCIASVHAEVSAKSDIVAIHEVIDDAEREIGQQLNIVLCIHMDPIVTDDENVNRVHAQMLDYLKIIDPGLTLHDFRMAPGQGHINLIFDCVLPVGFKDSDGLRKKLEEYALTLDKRYRLVVQFDTDYS